MNLTYNNTPQLQEANVEVVIHNVEGDEKIDITYHDVGHETSIVMVKKYKRVQVVLCQDVQQLG